MSRRPRSSHVSERLTHACAGARERLAAQLAPPRAAVEHRREVVDRAARPARRGVTAPARTGIGTDAARRVAVAVSGRRARHEPAARDRDPG